MSAVRDAKISKGGGLRRSASDIRKGFEALGLSENPAVVRFSKDVTAYFAGKVGDIALQNAIERLMVAEEVEAEEVEA